MLRAINPERNELEPEPEPESQVVIADECHMLKNQNTKRARAILPMLRNSARAILLSGEPRAAKQREV